MVRRASPPARRGAGGREPDAAVFELPRTYPRGRAGEEDDESGTRAPTRASASTSTSGPLIVFGSSPSPNPVPSLTNDPTTNASSGQPERRRARLARRPASTSGKASSSIPIGMRCTRSGSTPDGEDELLDLPVRDVDALEAGRDRAGAPRTPGRTRGIRASPADRGSTRARDGASSPSTGGRARRSGSCGRRPDARARGPRRRREPVAGPPGDRGDVRGLVVERPVERVVPRTNSRE